MIVFSHDPKFDEPAIIAALRSGAGYIGALGSRRTAADRASALVAAGAQRGRARPRALACGLDIGAATPEEVAISIMAEVIAARSGRAGEALVSARGPDPPALTRAASSCAGVSMSRSLPSAVARDDVHASHPRAGLRAPSSPRSSATAANSARSSRTGWPGRPA